MRKFIFALLFVALTIPVSAQSYKDGRALTLLASHTITTAESATAVGTTSTFPGTTQLVAQAKFIYGSSGGTSTKCYVQTSLDGGTTWVDIISFAFTTATATKVSSVTGYIAPGSQALAPTDGSLADNTVINGVIGDRFRLKYVTTGTYVGATSIEVKIVIR